MKPTIISRKAGNWVDRGEPAIPKLASVLAYFFERHAEPDQAWLAEQANTILGMVAADATEVHIAGYLKSVVHEIGGLDREPLGARAAGIALWHIAKVALVRDFAERVLQGDVPVNAPTGEPLSEWLIKRLLTPAELARYEQEPRDQE